MTQKQRSIAIFSAASSLLAVPFIGMQFTKEINWSPFDFVVAGGLLFTAAFFLDFILRKVKSTKNRLLLLLLLFVIVFLVWVELAVGLFGSPFAGS